jgi:hypothetical protein
MRLAVGLTVIGALLLVSGALMVLAGEAMGLASPGPWHHLVGAGETLAILGFAVGLAVVFVLASGASRNGLPDAAAAQHGHAAQRGHGGQRGRGGRRGRDAAAEDWLSPLRPAGTEQVPETERQPMHDPAQERGLPGYADDGWHPEELSATYADLSGLAGEIYDPGQADQQPSWPDMRPWQEALPQFDPATDPHRDYQAQTLPTGEPEARRPEARG